MDLYDPDELADGMQHFYNRCKLFPESDPKAFIAMIELRALAPYAIELLRDLAARQRQQASKRKPCPRDHHQE